MKEEKLCSISHCKSVIFSKKLCRKHYEEYRQEISTNRCSFIDCERIVYGKGLCKKHYERERRKGNPSSKTDKDNKKCSIEGCKNQYNAAGYCSTHYSRYKKYGNPLFEPVRPKKEKPEKYKRICKISECNDVVYNPQKGLCKLHYEQEKNQPCIVEGCSQTKYIRGYCSHHYAKWRKYGDPLYSSPHRGRKAIIEKCSIPDCNKKHYARGYCYSHWKKHNKYGDPLYDYKKVLCSASGCQNTQTKSGYCSMHNEQIRRKKRAKNSLHCTVENCFEPHAIQGFCWKHAQQMFSSNSNSSDEICRVEGCLLRSFQLGICELHYREIALLYKVVSKKRCKVKDCYQISVGQGYCWTHYARFRRYGNPDITMDKERVLQCIIKECSYPDSYKGLCEGHHNFMIKNKFLFQEYEHIEKNTTCKVKGCKEGAKSKGYCDKHYKKWRLYGDPLHTNKKCLYHGCNELQTFYGLCNTHYNEFVKIGALNPELQEVPTKDTCVIVGCVSLAERRGYCGKHYSRINRTGRPFIKRAKRPSQSTSISVHQYQPYEECKIETCSEPSFKDGLCPRHYAKSKRKKTKLT